MSAISRSELRVPNVFHLSKHRLSPSVLTPPRIALRNQPLLCLLPFRLSPLLRLLHILLCCCRWPSLSLWSASSLALALPLPLDLLLLLFVLPLSLQLLLLAAPLHSLLAVLLPPLIA